MRDYDPTTGRYVEADPLGLVDGASVYGYALQNPGRWTDPTGEIIPVILVVVVLAALLTPDAANAPGYCDELVWPDPLAPYINGMMAGIAVAPFIAAGVTSAATASGADALGVTVFQTTHYAPRLIAEGVNVARAEAAVAKEVAAIRQTLTAGSGVRAQVVVDGVTIQFRVHMLPNGVVNVGTIFVPK